MLTKWPNLRAPPFHKGAEEEVDAAEGVVTEKAMTISIRNTEKKILLQLWEEGATWKQVP
jgi:hypothetical protein